MDETGFALEMIKKHSKEEAENGIEFYKKLVADLENKDVPAMEIVERFAKETGRTAKDIEMDIRKLYAETFRTRIEAFEHVTASLEDFFH